MAVEVVPSRVAAVQILITGCFFSVPWVSQRWPVVMVLVIARLWWRVLVGDKFGGARWIVQGRGFLEVGEIPVGIAGTDADEVLPRQCPCLGLLIHGESVGAGGFNSFRQKQDAHESLPRLGPPEGKDLHPACLILYCWYSLSCYNGGADEI
jgi:hypothetical protein